VLVQGGTANARFTTISCDKPGCSLARTTYSQYDGTAKAYRLAYEAGWDRAEIPEKPGISDLCPEHILGERARRGREAIRAREACFRA
jgi:hypothetical protein